MLLLKISCQAFNVWAHRGQRVDVTRPSGFRHGSWPFRVKLDAPVTPSSPLLQYLRPTKQYGNQMPV